MRLPALAVMLLTGLLALPASADYAAAVAALHDKDYASALSLMKQSADEGNSKAMYGLGLMYWEGDAMPANPDEALRWFKKASDAGNPTAMNTLAHIYYAGSHVKQDYLAARDLAEKSANLGDPDSAILFFSTVINGPELNYNTNGHPDQAKYNAIARRSIAERALDIKAYDMLGKALAEGSNSARLLILAELADKVGPGNRSELLQRASELPQLPAPVEKIRMQAQVLQGVGESYTNTTAFLNARDVAMVNAVVQGQSAGVIKIGLCSPEQLKIKRTAISRLLADALYLPTTTVPLQNVYLIAGNWQETWVFDACGESIVVPIEFRADGFGGVTFQARSTPLSAANAPSH